MDDTILSVFVDESGKFQHPDSTSRYYVVGMVFHRQSDSIAEAVKALDATNASLGFDPERFAFHAGPLVRAEKNFSMMSRNFRGKIFGTTANCRKRRLIDLRFLRYEGLTAVA